MARRSVQKRKSSSYSLNDYRAVKGNLNFVINEDVFVKWSGEFYAARIFMIVEDEEEKVFYGIHYMHWNNSHNEFIAEEAAKTRIRKFDKRPHALRLLNQQVGESRKYTPP